MLEEDSLPRRLRFGVFEVDLRGGELRKHGLRIRLQAQPFQVLAMLLEHPREVVSREELQKRLWPADTFVDFDHGLNKAVNKIREALADSGQSAFCGNCRPPRLPFPGRGQGGRRTYGARRRFRQSEFWRGDHSRSSGSSW